MTNDEFNQHAQAADAASASDPCDGMRRLLDEEKRVYDEVFSSEAIEKRLTLWNRAYAAEHGLLDAK